MDAGRVEVRARLLGRVQVLNLQVASAYKVVVAHDDASDGREEDRVG